MGRPVTHWQIVTSDPDRAADFYTRMFDWTVDADNPLAYRMLRTGTDRGIEGGVWPAPPEASSFVQLHVEVPDVAAAVARAESLGATVLIPPQKLPDGDEMAVVKDPCGVPLALRKAVSG